MDNKKAFTIMYHDSILSPWDKEFLKKKARDYTLKTGIEIKFEGVSNMGWEDYHTKLTSKLLLEEGPTILIESDQTYYYWSRKPFFDVTRIPNYDNVLNGLKSDKFIPFLSYMPSLSMNYDVITSSGLDPYELTIDQYKELKMDKLMEGNTELDCIEYLELKLLYFSELDIYDDIGDLRFTSDEVLKAFEDLKEVIDEELHIFPNVEPEQLKNYLYATDRETGPKASSKRRQTPENYLLPYLYSSEYNGMNLHYIKEYTNNKKTMMVPNFFKRDLLSNRGFLINSNGENIAGAIGYIDMILDKDTQMEIFEQGSGGNRYLDYAPVVSNIEEEKNDYYKRLHVEPEAVKITNIMLDRLQNDYYNTWFEGQSAIYYLDRYIYDYLFTDKYQDIDELKKALKEFENKINFYE